MKIIEYANNWLIGTAHAQNVNESWRIGDFTNLLRPVDGNLAVDTLFARLIGWFLAIAAIVAFVMLIWYGIQYLTAGGDDAKATGARKGIVNAVIGIIVIIAAYVLIGVASNLGTNLVR